MSGLRKDECRTSRSATLSRLRRRLPLLHALLLLHMPLLQLLGLLLVPLLDLLPSELIGLLAFHPLVFLNLFLLKFLPLFFLLCVYFFFLLLVFPVVVGITGLRGSGTLQRRKVFRMHCWPVPAARLCGSTIGRRIVRRTCLPRRHDGAIVKFCRFRSSVDRRPAAIGRCMQLGIRPRRLTMLCLSPHRREMPLPCGSLFLRAGTFIDQQFAVECSACGHQVFEGNLDYQHSTQQATKIFSQARTQRRGHRNRVSTVSGLAWSVL